MVVVEVAVLGVLRGGDMERECEGQGVVVVVGRNGGRDALVCLIICVIENNKGRNQTYLYRRRLNSLQKTKVSCRPPPMTHSYI